MTAKHRPPSQVRYAATHPSKTIHFDAPTYASVEALLGRSGLTANQFIRQALGSMERHIDEIQERGRVRHTEDGRKLGFAEGCAKGFAEAMAMYRVTYPCQGCGEPIELDPAGEDGEHAIAMFKREQWGHEACDKTPPVESSKPPTAPPIGPMRMLDPGYRRA